MAVPELKYAIGNAASTTLSASMSNTATSCTITSDTNFAAKSGEGMVIVDEDASTEEYIYSASKSSNTLSTPLVNRGLEGGSAQAHSSTATVKGIITAGMWNDLIDAMLNVVDQTTGAVDTTKVVTLTGTQTLTNKTLTSPSITTPSVTSGDVNLATGLNIQVNSLDPKRGLYVPASAMFGATTTGAASGQYESSSNKVNVKVLDFDTTSDEYGCFNIPAPDYWDLSTVTAKFHWTSAGGTPTQTVTWGIQALARSDDDALDTAYGTAVTVADTLITTNDEHVTSSTSAMTVGGTPAKGDMLYFRIYRDVSEDNVSDDARLLGVRIKFGISQYDDQ